MPIEEAIEDIKNNIKPVVGGKSLDVAINALEAIQELRSIDDSDKSIQAPEYWDGWYRAIGIINKHIPQ